jgi:hypothetical protein
MRARHQGRCRQVEGRPRRAPRGGARHRPLESAPVHWPRHAVVAHHPGGADRWHAMARRVLPGLRDDEPGDRSADRRSPPAGLGRHAGARASEFMVSGVGADAEAFRAVCAATREPRPRRDNLTTARAVFPAIPNAIDATRGPDPTFRGRRPMAGSCRVSRFGEVTRWCVEPRKQD